MPRLPWEITLDQVLSPTETDHLLAQVRRAARDRQADDPTPAVDQLIIECLLFSGLRCSEFCLLKLADAPGSNPQAAFQVRNRSEGRTVWLPAPIAALARDYVRRVRPLLAARAAGRPADAFLLNERGRAYERTGLYRRVVSVLTAAGLAEKASVQLLRHTYGYLAYLRTGGNLLFVQRQLGHAHPMITAVYANLVEESYPRLAECIMPVRRTKDHPNSNRHLPKDPSRKRRERATQTRSARE